MQQHQLIDVREALRCAPPVDNFPSVDELCAVAENLRTDARFEVLTAGQSLAGTPIHHIRYGAGAIKALIVGGPHAVEPIGNLTILGLIAALRAGALDRADVEWHIVPCIDPDGARLNESWSTRPFDFDRYLRGFYLQARPLQVDFSFPISYKQLHFDRPSHEAAVLKNILDRVKPDFYFSLHNYMAMGGVWHALSHDIGAPWYQQIHDLVAEHGLNSQPNVSGSPALAAGVVELPTLRRSYENLERRGLTIPDEYVQGRVGASSVDYLLELKPGALAFISELPYGQHQDEISLEPTPQHLRQLKLRLFADRKFLATLIIEAWDRVHDDLDRASPLFGKISHDLIAARDRLSEGVTEWYERTFQSLLFNRADAKFANKAERIQTLMTHSHFLGNAYCFVRLLKASRQTEAVRHDTELLDDAFDSAIAQVKQLVEFDAFAPIKCESLLKVQLGSGLIALNSVLARFASAQAAR